MRRRVALTFAAGTAGLVLTLSASVAAEGEMAPCSPVTIEACDALARYGEHVRSQRQITERGVEFGGGFQGISLGGKASKKSASETVAMSDPATDAHGLLLQACSLAATNPTPQMVGAFWTAYRQMVPDISACDTTMVAAVPITKADVIEQHGAVDVQVQAQRTGGDHLLLDVDLGVPVGVRVGYEFGRGHGVGVRAGVGPALSASSASASAAGVVAAFGRIGLGGEGRTRIEPSVGMAIVSSSSAAFLAGIAVAHQFVEENGARPGLGVRGGVDIAIISSSAWVLPEGSLVLHW